ncbi:MAG TPA: hypothetical protein VLK84_20045 [Longimicrobium sp.]|nr:hypothetical protein [Longimicrobium sp.]
MPYPATATMTAAEFDRRVEAAEAYENRGLAWVWSPAGIALVVFLVAVALGEERAELLGNVAVIVMMPSILGGIVLMLVREQRAVGRFGLACPGCAMPLPGGRSNENTIHVRKTGCCATCGAPVLRDHPGAMEAAAREAAVPRTPPHPRAFTRDDFDRRLARARRRVKRRIDLFIATGLGGLPALAGIALLPWPAGVEAKLMNAGLFIIPGLLIGTMFSARWISRREGLECPACRQDPLEGETIAVVRTGICPHCSTVIIKPGP